MVESYHKVANGCSKWPNCFTYPFEDCKISFREGMRTGEPVVRKQREQEILKLIEEGLSYREIGEKFGYTKRTITRIKRKCLTKSEI